MFRSPVPCCIRTSPESGVTWDLSHFQIACMWGHRVSMWHSHRAVGQDSGHVGRKGWTQVELWEWGVDGCKWSGCCDGSWVCSIVTVFTRHLERDVLIIDRLTGTALDTRKALLFVLPDWGCTEVTLRVRSVVTREVVPPSCRGNVHLRLLCDGIVTDLLLAY